MLLSKHFLVIGKGNGTDQVQTFQPWEPEPIRIVGAEIIRFNPEPCQYVFVGNWDVPDIMCMMGYGERRAVNWFPAGLWFDFPVKGYNDQAWISVHCCSMYEYQLFAVVYYTKCILS